MLIKMVNNDYASDSIEIETDNIVSVVNEKQYSDYHLVFSNANLQDADLQDANLQDANLQGADLQRADLQETYLYDAKLQRANLSGTKGLLKASEWLKSNFDTVVSTDSKLNGYLVYKAIGNTNYNLPKYWEIKEGSFIEEVVNIIPTDDCACGVNFATKEWCTSSYSKSNIWLCRINWIDLSSLVVPYNTNGKARCGRLELIRKVK